MAFLSIPKRRILAISLHTREKQGYSPGVMRRAGAVCLVALVGVLTLGGGAPSARAAAPPTIVIEVIGSGKVTGAGINCGLNGLACYAAYSSAAAQTLTEAPGGGWTFDQWEDGCAGAATTCSATPGTNQTVTAVFAPPAGTVQTSTYGVALASATPGGTVTNGSVNYSIGCPASACSLTTYQGSTITVVETPDSTHFFGEWGGSCSGTAVSCATYLVGNQTATATFVASTTQSLEVAVSGSGSVVGGGISCGPGSTCDAQEPPNASVTLTAQATDGYAFTGWSGSCTGMQQTCTVQMDASRSVTATFQQLVPFSLTISGAGTVSGGGVTCGPGPQTCNGTLAPGQTVTFTATPTTGGSVFWSGCSSTAGNICSIVVSSGAVSITATFSGGTPPPIATYLLSLVVQGDGYVVSASNSSLHCTAAGGTGCNVNVNANTTLTLTAIPASGSAGDFTHWQQACSTFTTTTCTLTMTGPKTVEADFAGGNTTYVLTGQVVGSGTISGGGLSCTGSGGAGCNVPQAAGAGITLTAAPSFGATFSGWSGACSGTSTICAVSMTNAKSVTATFATSTGFGSSSLALTVTPAGTVTFTGGTCVSTGTKSKTCTAEFNTGQKVSLDAKPAAGFAFTRWTGACAGQKAACDLTLNSSVVVGTVFERLALEPKGAASVVKTPGGYRVTLSYISRLAGKLKLTAKRGSATVASTTGKVTPGNHRISLVVTGKGRYVLTLSVGTHAIRWRVTIR